MCEPKVANGTRTYHGNGNSQYYSRTPVSADSISAVSVIRGLPRPENINTSTAKVDHGRFKYLRFNLPASTLVDLKFTLRFYV
jgi:hypothetical protein